MDTPEYFSAIFKEGNIFMISFFLPWITETFQIGIRNSRKDFDPTGNAIRQKLRGEERMKPVELFPLKCIRAPTSE